MTSVTHNQTSIDENISEVASMQLRQRNEDRVTAKRKRGIFRYMEFSRMPKSEEFLQPYTWKGKLRNFLHSKPCHIAVIVLTLIDVALVMIEIILDLKNAENCEGEHATESVGAEVVHFMSIAILSIFLVEIALKLIADWTHFWAHKMEIFDAFVVITAFACDVTITFIGMEAIAAVGLLIMLRLWRVVRVINGIILTVKNEGDERVHALKHQITEIQADLENKTEEIKKLRNILSENGIKVEEEPQKERETLESALGIDTVA